MHSVPILLVVILLGSMIEKPLAQYYCANDCFGRLKACNTQCITPDCMGDCSVLWTGCNESCRKKRGLASGLGTRFETDKEDDALREFSLEKAKEGKQKRKWKIAF